MVLIKDLIGQGWLKTPRIIEAFQKIKRKDFLPANSKGLAQLNKALPIGYSQTISQPLTVAFMLELLGPKAGDRILDIGSGSGWTTALLAEIVGQKGKIIALEIIPELRDFGQNNAAKYNFLKKGIAKFVCADGSKGDPQFAARPELAEGYDKILVSASSQKNSIPKAWGEQLKIGGRIVCPIKNSVWLFIKKLEKEFEGLEYPGFVFVPLTRNVAY